MKANVCQTASLGQLPLGGGGGSYLFMKYDVFRQNAEFFKEWSVSSLTRTFQSQYDDHFHCHNLYINFGIVTHPISIFFISRSWADDDIKFIIQNVTLGFRITLLKSKFSSKYTYKIQKPKQNTIITYDNCDAVNGVTIKWKQCSVYDY